MGYRRVLAVVLGLVAGCSTYDQRLDPDAPDPVGGAVLQSQDINSMADQMAREIVASGILRSNDPAQRVAFHITKLRNDSSDPMDTELILTRIRTQLFQALGRQVKFLDRSSEAAEEVLAERAAKRSNAVTANPARAGSVAGSDYVLKGTIKDRVVQSRDLKSVAYTVTFELTDLETQELVWTGEYLAKFGTEKSVISR
jgi:PBP1b-binding outer membrane lipoprotein LpoB